mgnify:CR=1 FL=1
MRLSFSQGMLLLCPFSVDTSFLRPSVRPSFLSSFCMPFCEHLTVASPTPLELVPADLFLASEHTRVTREHSAERGYAPGSWQRRISQSEATPTERTITDWLIRDLPGWHGTHPPSCVQERIRARLARAMAVSRSGAQMAPFSPVSARFWGNLGRLRASSTRPKGLLELGARMATLAQALRWRRLTRKLALTGSNTDRSSSSTGNTDLPVVVTVPLVLAACRCSRLRMVA